MAKLETVILRGTRAAQPDPEDVGAGTLYFVTDETVLERSDGTAAWESYSSGVAAIQDLLDSLGSTQGHVLYRNASDWVVLAVGTNGQVLTSGGAGANISWTTPATVQSLLDGISTTQGTIIYYNGTDWVALTPGTNGHYLQTQGAGANPQWAAVASANIQTLLDTISTTQGVILYYNGTDWVALGTGTNGHFLKTQGAGANPTWAAASATVAGAIGITIDGGGSAITTGVKGYIYVPYACTITAVTMLADVSGSAVVDIWKDSYANHPPTDADSITASAVPTITTATKSQDTTLTGWTTSVSAGDILGFNVDSASTITRLHLVLTTTR